MFVEIGSYLLANKLVAFLALAYVIVALVVTFKFNSKFVFDTRSFEFVANTFDWCGKRGWRRWFGMAQAIVAIIVTTMLFAPAAPLLYAYQKHNEAVARAKEEERRNEIDGERKRLRLENEDRAEGRKRYFSKPENRLKIYYTAEDGFAAALRPDRYEYAGRASSFARTNGIWDKQALLCPVTETVLFVTKPGLEKAERRNVRQWCGSARFLSELHELAERHGAELVKVPDIFVPWVNASLVPFDEQRAFFGDSCGANAEYLLITAQIPEELREQPVP